MWIIVSVYLFIWSLLVTKACYLGIKKENKNFCNCPLVLLWKHEFHTLTKEGHLLVIPWDCQWPLLQGLNSPKEEFIVIDPNKKKKSFFNFIMWISRFDNEHLQATGAELGDSIFNVTGWSTTYVLITVIGLTGVRVGFLI